MEVYKTVVFPMIILLAFVVLCVSLYLLWRHVRFFRNPQRIIPPEGTCILSPADGTVVCASETSACYPCTFERFSIGRRYRNSTHIIRNERTVTKIEGKYRGNELACYVVQTAARSVSGTDVSNNKWKGLTRLLLYGCSARHEVLSKCGRVASGPPHGCAWKLFFGIGRENMFSVVCKSIIRG